jgi:hypothetical protein
MRKVSILFGLSALTLSIFLLVNSSPLFGTGRRTADVPTTYKVTVTNLTRGQPLSPVVIATHSKALQPIFEVGEQASAELYQVAEDAILDPLINGLLADMEVFDVETLTGMGGPILPGETASVMIESDTGFPLISMVSMLVVTNDAFFGLNGAELPVLERVKLYSPAYDAGSETNNEYGRFIPGPPFGSGGIRDTSMAEGFVHVHSGVFGKSSLIPEQHDWRNPVAQIIVEPQ